jgi:MGT family glycosyltransferase
MAEKQEPLLNARPLTILFVPYACHGPMNQCIGMSDILRRRGHRVVIVLDPTWKGKLASFGFEECIIDIANPADKDAETKPGEFWANYVRDALPKFRKPTIVQLDTYIQPTWRTILEEAKLYDEHLRSIIDHTRADVIVQDNVACFPTLVTGPAPFVRVVSCNPLEMPGINVPPTYSGLPLDDRSEWDAFRTKYDRLHRTMWEEFSTWVQSRGAPPLPDLQFTYESEYANIYIYPEEADYTTNRPLGPKWHRIDSSVRETDARYELPAAVRDRPTGSGLIYVSLGSLGCADVELMQRLISVLSQSHHRFIVSKGLLGDSLKLPDSMVGESTLPQTKVIPLVDLVITHGGNNTVTETLHFGKPMVLLPIFWDQHDNAQRMHELDFGVRIDTYGFTDEELLGAINKLLDDTILRDHMAQLGEQIRQRDGLRSGADIVERVGRAYADRTSEEPHT